MKSKPGGVNMIESGPGGGLGRGDLAELRGWHGRSGSRETGGGGSTRERERWAI
jgi:hypothetical protein